MATPGCEGYTRPEVSSTNRRLRHRRFVYIRTSSRIVGPLACAPIALVLAENARFATAVLAFVVLACGNLLAGRGGEPWWAHLLPFMRVVARFSGPALGGIALLLTLRLTGTFGELAYAEVLFIIAVTAGVTLVAERLGRAALDDLGRTRVAVIGSSHVADSLQRELRLANVRDYEVVGYVAVAERWDPSEVPFIGTVQELGELVGRHDVHLLLLASGVPRLTVFNEFTQSCLQLPVRLEELSGFYEAVFGHVPVADINAAWFQYLMQSGSRAKHSTLQRLLDVVGAVIALALSWPLILGLMAMIRRDGGPVLFRQIRIGEGGRPFTVIKLRTMAVGSSGRWARADDDRVTPIGHVLRRTHLDELPQLIQVVRGEMSIVGPRPEQPEFVEHLEKLVPFYARRHLVRPGLTGWAQVRCGYAGSDLGSAWKVAHDLFYLKHRSFRLNLVILGETLRTLVADPQYTAEPTSVEFILAPTRSECEQRSLTDGPISDQAPSPPTSITPRG
jgi:exopolysaccharide biosynthesis polyprenyl glycosylphosphotransferase